MACIFRGLPNGGLHFTFTDWQLARRRLLVIPSTQSALNYV